MGRYKKGIQGAFSGKIGNVVGATWRGIDYMRSLSKKTKKPPTQAQINQRLRFALVMNWLKPLLPLIKVGYGKYLLGKTELNAAISYQLKNAITGTAPDYEIVYAKTILSIGELLPSWVTSVMPLINTELEIKWEDHTASPYCADDDLASFVVFNPAKQQFMTFLDVVNRVKKSVILKLPAKFSTDIVHCWMCYKSEDGSKVSTSIYLGTVSPT